MNASHRRLLTVMTILALLMGLFVSFVVRPFPGHDAAAYERIADNLVAGRGYSLSGAEELATPTRFRMPGYPLFLAGIRLMFGPNRGIVLIVQSLLLSVNVLLLYLLAQRLFGSKYALVPTALLAVYPYTAYWAATIYTETMTTTLVLASLLLVESVPRHTAKIAMAGFALGLATLCRPIIILLAPLLACVYVFRNRCSTAVKPAILLVIMSLLPLAPWTIRNYITFGKPTILVEGQLGVALLKATLEFRHHPLGLFVDDNPTYRSQLEDALLRSGAVDGDDPAANPYLLEHALANIKASPATFLASCLIRAPRIWMSFYTPGLPRFGMYVSGILSFAFLLIGIIGIWSWRRELNVVGAPLAVVVYFTLVHIFFLSQGRYTIPARPAMVLFVGTALLLGARQTGLLGDRFHRWCPNDR